MAVRSYRAQQAFTKGRHHSQTTTTTAAAKGVRSPEAGIGRSDPWSVERVKRGGRLAANDTTAKEEGVRDTGSSTAETLFWRQHYHVRNYKR